MALPLLFLASMMVYQSYQNYHERIISAAKHGETAKLHRSLSWWTNSNYRTSTGVSPLWAAAYSGHEGTVKLLLAHGADRNQSGPEGATPLMIATQQGNEKIIKLLS